LFLEDKRLTLSVHYRLAAESRHDAIRTAARACANRQPQLRVTEGKRVVEVRPVVDWDKGRAATFIIDRLEIPDDAAVLYIGDDRTDEDAFAALADRGAGVIVAESRPTDSAARFHLESPAAVASLLEALCVDAGSDDQ
jgi:trehalose 6-phosphate phosphatase